MSFLKDDAECAVLIQHTPQSDFEFVIYTTGKLTAYRSAERYKKDLRDLGELEAQALVVVRADYDAGLIKPLDIPAEFLLDKKSTAIIPKVKVAPEGSQVHFTSPKLSGDLEDLSSEGLGSDIDL